VEPSLQISKATRAGHCISDDCWFAAAARFLVGAFLPVAAHSAHILKMVAGVSFRFWLELNLKGAGSAIKPHHPVAGRLNI
jgi:hypothetical protein